MNPRTSATKVIANHMRPPQLNGELHDSRAPGGAASSVMESRAGRESRKDDSCPAPTDRCRPDVAISGEDFRNFAG